MNRMTAIFLVMFLTFSTLFGYRSAIHTAAAQMNVKYSQYLTNATHAAADQMVYNEDTGESMGTPAIRSEVERAFFNTLLTNMGAALTTQADAGTNGAAKDVRILYKYIPVVMMIDNDGFYTWYNIYTDDGLDGQTSSLTTWGNTYAEGGQTYYVRFFLGDRVQVTTKGSTDVIDGKPVEVFEKCGKPSTLTGVIDSEDNYNIERNRVVAKSVEDTIQYYINYENQVNGYTDDDGNVTQRGQKYVFTMPQISGGDFVEMVEHPSVISFLQGVKINDAAGYLNIYAFTGGEYKANKRYYVTGNPSNGTGYYHVDGCSKVTDADKTRIYSSRRELATLGYKPCPDCDP